jgi:hypothetical protein
MKLAALCCTFHRPHLLGQLIESFRRQDYPLPLRELIILDDAGQYDNQEGEGWRVISIPRRFRTLGEKRNACAALASPDVTGFLIADDDDIYLPHWFRTQAVVLRQADWSRPSVVLVERKDGLKEQATDGLYHASWAFRRVAFDRVRGYAPVNNGEDQELAGRLVTAKVTQCDPCSFAPPFFIHRVENESYHVSYLDDCGFQALGSKKAEKSSVRPHWPREYQKLPVIPEFGFGQKVNSCAGKRPVELIGPIVASGRSGPANGMYTLQKALRGRIAEGLDWLSIRTLPVSRGALPWFWHWDDRRYAAWWDSQGQPFVQGPNMLFLHSGTPRIDQEECSLLDAVNCQAMFCHSPWYRDVIAKHRGPANHSPIVLWPYPIDPWPGEPLPDQYDLLIYAKNGNRPQLLEFLAERFPRHLQIHYGSYQREQLFETARRSRACAYLADDDHGPLALQEILLAGCPAVGVRTGAAFVEPGVTGQIVDRLPPGRACIAGPGDETALTHYMEMIERAQSMDRASVRAAAARSFATQRIVERVIAALDAARSVVATKPGGDHALAR